MSVIPLVFTLEHSSHSYKTASFNSTALLWIRLVKGTFNLEFVGTQGAFQVPYFNVIFVKITSLLCAHMTFLLVILCLSINMICSVTLPGGSLRLSCWVVWPYCLSPAPLPAVLLPRRCLSGNGRYLPLQFTAIYCCYNGCFNQLWHHS